MTTGKSCSQTGHAYANLAILAAQQKPELLRLYQGPDFIGTKIALSAKNEAAILNAHEAAQKAGLISTLIIDTGHIMLPHFDGSPTITALGIFGTREECRPITKKFQLIA